MVPSDVSPVGSATAGGGCKQEPGWFRATSPRWGVQPQEAVASRNQDGSERRLPGGECNRRRRLQAGTRMVPSDVSPVGSAVAEGYGKQAADNRS